MHDTWTTDFSVHSFSPSQDRQTLHTCYLLDTTSSLLPLGQHELDPQTASQSTQPFCRTHERDQHTHTDTQTDRPWHTAGSNRPLSLLNAAMWHKNCRQLILMNIKATYATGLLQVRPGPQKVFHTHVWGLWENDFSMAACPSSQPNMFTALNDLHYTWIIVRKWQWIMLV